MPSLIHWDPFFKTLSSSKGQILEGASGQIVCHQDSGSNFQSEFSIPQSFLRLEIMLGLWWGGRARTGERNEGAVAFHEVKVEFSTAPECLGTLWIPVIHPSVLEYLLNLKFCSAALLSNHSYNLLLVLKDLDTFFF